MLQGASNCLSGAAKITVIEALGGLKSAAV